MGVAVVMGVAFDFDARGRKFSLQGTAPTEIHSTRSGDGNRKANSVGFFSAVAADVDAGTIRNV